MIVRYIGAVNSTREAACDQATVAIAVVWNRHLSRIGCEQQYLIFDPPAWSAAESQKGISMNELPSGESSEQARIRFLDNELDLSRTFLNTAFLEDDDPANALLARSNAQTAHDLVLTWIDSIRDTKERDRLMNKLFDLRKKLDDFDRVRPPTQRRMSSE